MPQGVRTLDFTVQIDQAHHMSDRQLLVSIGVLDGIPEDGLRTRDVHHPYERIAVHDVSVRESRLRARTYERTHVRLFKCSTNVPMPDHVRMHPHQKNPSNFNRTCPRSDAHASTATCIRFRLRIFTRSCNDASRMLTNELVIAVPVAPHR